MRDENTFNAFLSKKFRALPGTASLKLAERHHIGISDFMLWRGGRSAGVEVKLIRGDLNTNAQILGHPFSGPQQTWLGTLMRAGTLAFGLVGHADLKTMWLIPADVIPPSGNWTGLELQYLADRVLSFSFKDVASLVNAVFAHRVEDGRCLR